MEDSVGCHQESFEGTVNFNRINSILRAGGYMTAGGVGEWRNGSPVKIDRQKYNLYQNPPDSTCYFFYHTPGLKLVIPQNQDEVT